MAQQATVTLRNAAFPPRPIVVHLPHVEVCAAAGECGCQRIRAGVSRSGPKGERTLVVVDKVVPGTITLLARGTTDRDGKPLDVVEGLPLAIQHAPEVRALRGKGLMVQVVPVPASAPARGEPERATTALASGAPKPIDPPAGKAAANTDSKET